MADLLTIAETAERLRVSARTVEREIAAGRLACVRIRSRRLVDPADLAAYIAASREQTWQSGSAGTDTRSEYASVVVAALSGLCRPVRSAFEAARKAAGLPDVRFHDLRHTYASWLAQDGASMAMIRDLLGHASVQTTSRYAHLGRRDLIEATRRVGDRLGSESPA